MFFEHSRSKKLRKNRVFLTPRKPKTTVFAVFFAPGTKNHGIYSVLWPAPSKTVVFTQFSACCKTYFCQAKRTKTPLITVFRRLKPDENRRKPPTSVQNGASRSGPKNQANGRSVFELSPARLRPHLSKTDRFRASPPTPPRLASLRFAYTYTQAQAFGWLS